MAATRLPSPDDMNRRSCLLGFAALAACRPARAPRPGYRTIPETDFTIRTSYPPMPALNDDVYVARRKRLAELARADGAASVFVMNGTATFSYLVGADVGRSERLVAFVWALDGQPFVIAPSFEVPRMRARAVDVVGWEEHEDPVKLAASKLRGKVLADPRTELAVASALGRALEIVEGSRAFEELRVTKSEEEVARMKRAIAITEHAFAATFARLEPGMLERDVAKIVRDEHQRRGADGYALVQFGPNAALPHGGPTTTPLTPETVVLMDGGCSVQGWQSDITRTRWFGTRPSARFVEVYNVVHDAQTAAIARVAPGVPAEEVDRAARDVITKAGFGPAFTHRTGHGIGMEGHEPVYLVRGNARPLTPGAAFTIEPGIYLRGELGVRIEDMFVCGDRGATVLSRRAPRLT
jgi:Xaa-Pro dipeptidase